MVSVKRKTDRLEIAHHDDQIFNSLFITLVGTLINMFLTILAAYTLTRPGLVGKKVLMVFFIVMMLFDPGIVYSFQRTTP